MGSQVHPQRIWEVISDRGGFFKSSRISRPGLLSKSETVRLHAHRLKQLKNKIGSLGRGAEESGAAVQVPAPVPGCRGSSPVPPQQPGLPSPADTAPGMPARCCDWGLPSSLVRETAGGRCSAPPSEKPIKCS